jgi:hypothetical protein
VRNALISDAKSAADFHAISTLGTTDSTGGRAFRISDAEAKALGLRAGNASGIDGWVGFNSSASYTFDPITERWLASTTLLALPSIDC